MDKKRSIYLVTVIVLIGLQFIYPINMIKNGSLLIAIFIIITGSMLLIFKKRKEYDNFNVFFCFVLLLEHIVFSFGYAQLFGWDVLGKYEQNHTTQSGIYVELACVMLAGFSFIIRKRNVLKAAGYLVIVEFVCNISYTVFYNVLFVLKKIGGVEQALWNNLFSYLIKLSKVSNSFSMPVIFGTLGEDDKYYLFSGNTLSECITTNILSFLLVGMSFYVPMFLLYQEIKKSEKASLDELHNLSFVEILPVLLWSVHLVYAFLVRGELHYWYDEEIRCPGILIDFTILLVYIGIYSYKNKYAITILKCVIALLFVGGIVYTLVYNSCIFLEYRDAQKGIYAHWDKLDAIRKGFEHIFNGTYRIYELGYYGYGRFIMIRGEKFSVFSSLIYNLPVYVVSIFTVYLPLFLMYKKLKAAK